MKLDTLKPAIGSIKKGKRIGRGQGSGKGGTSTRGHKGAKSRSGYKTKFGFEGGQMPLQRRIPKFGFKNPNRKEFKVINLDSLQKLSDEKGITTFTHEAFLELNLISQSDRIKILGRGNVTSKLDVTAHAFSEVAKTAIENLGGTVSIIE